MGIKESIEQFGDGESWVYDGWTGRVGGETFPIEEWFAAMCEGPGSRSTSGPHRNTPEEADADARKFAKGDESHEPYETAYVVRYAPALRISVHHDVEV